MSLQCPKVLRGGDTLVVWKLDWLGRDRHHHLERPADVRHVRGPCQVRADIDRGAYQHEADGSPGP
jgi:hypothetical protein